MKITKEGFAIVETDSHIGKWVEESGRLDHDQNVLPQILPFIPEGGIVIDIGANIGSHTIAYAKKVGLTGNVFAYEPNPEAFKCLVYNMKELVNVFEFPFAIGNTIGSIDVIQENENLGMAYVKESKNGIAIITTLDKEMKDIQKVDFIKIDVEGFEIDVLKGARETILKFNPVMLIEVNEGCLARRGYTKHDLFKEVESLDYTFRNVYKEQGFEDNQFDILCFTK